MTQRAKGWRRCARRLAAAMLLAPALAPAADFEPITPYRPTVSNPAQLPAVGQLELELGGQQTHTGGVRRGTVPYDIKLAFSPEWGMLLSGDAHVWLRGDGDHASGVGDTNVVLKRAWLESEGNAFGLELNIKLPTANDLIGSGKNDYAVNTIWSHDFGAVHMDTNLTATRLGAFDAGTSRTQIGGAAAFSTPLTEQWSIVGELSGTHRQGADSSVQLLGAFTYSPTKLITFDIGVSRSPHPTPVTTAVFAGVVFPLAKLW